MKKWIQILACLGYFTPVFGTAHDTFMVTGDELQEVSNFPHYLQTPNFFTHVYPENINPNLVLITRTNRGFAFGVTGFSSRIFDNQTDYAIVDFADASGAVFTPSLASSIKAIPPESHFGYGAYLGYVYPYTGKDIFLDFSIIDGARSNTTDKPFHGSIWTPLALYDRSITAKGVMARYSTNIQQAKLLVGEEIRPGTRFRFHPSFGAKYAEINRKLSTSYLEAAGILEDPHGNTVVREKSEFRGIGPAIQLDGAYFFAPHLGLTAHALTAIIVGTIQSSIRVNDLQVPPLEAVPPSNTQINLKSTDRTVPNITGKIGLVYEYPLCGSLMKIDLEVGYQFDHFFNAIDIYRSTGSVILADSLVTTASTTYIDTPLHIKRPNDLTLAGPYLSFGISGISCPSDSVIDPVCLTVPRQEGGFVFGIGPVYYRIQTNQQDFSISEPNLLQPVNIAPIDLLSPQPLFIPSIQSSLKNVRSNNAGGLLITGGYIFRDSPYDITAHFEGAKTQNRKTAKQSNDNKSVIIWPILSIPFLDPSANRVFASDAKTNAKYSYSEFHVDIGQAINGDSLFWARLFAGIQYALIKQNFNVTYDNLTTVPIFPGTGSTNVPIPLFFPQEQIVQESNFSGIGPRVGLDFGLPFGNLSLVSELATGFLAGNVDASYKDAVQPGFLPNPVLGGQPIPVIPFRVLGTKVEGDHPYSPFFDLKIALAYTWNFFSGTKWSVELGYRAIHYFNALTTFTHLTNNAAVFAKQIGDVSLDGPYLNLTVFGFDACPPDCAPKGPFCVYVPELKGGIELAFEWLYAKPHATNIDFGILDPTPVIIPVVETSPPGIYPQGIPLNPSAASAMKVLSPRSHSGGRVHLGYIFPLTSNDLSVNATLFNEKNYKFITAKTPGVIWTINNGNVGIQNPLAQSFFPVLANRADVSVKFKWLTDNVEFGKRIKFHQLMTRFFAGLSYAKIKEGITIVYSEGLTNFLNPTATFVPLDTINQLNDFWGVGPRFGLAGDLALGCGFSLIGQIATDLLVGKFDSHYIEQSSYGQVDVLNPNKRNRFVPELDGKFGAAYTVVLKNCSQVSLEGGYSANHYFKVKDSLRFTGAVSSFLKQNQDISFSGPYVRLQIDF